MSFGGMMRFQRNPEGSLTLRTEVEVHVPAGTALLAAEETLMVAVNKAGAGLRGQLPESMDADGKPVTCRGRTLTAKAKQEVRHVETPCGCHVIERRAYQSSLGGSGSSPRDRSARLMGAATPKFARMVRRKTGENARLRSCQGLARQSRA